MTSDLQDWLQFSQNSFLPDVAVDIYPRQLWQTEYRLVIDVLTELNVAV